MKLVGLTGGIASGKSVVSARLAEHGAVVVDADKLARAVVEPGTPGLEAIRKQFGDAVILADGSLDRPALGAIIFTDADRRAELDAITHPAIWVLARQLFDAATRQDPNAVIVYDVPLLAEAQKDRPMTFDVIVVVQASATERMRRLTELRGLSEQDAAARIGSQASDDQRLAIADVVIDSGGTLAHTIEQVDALWEELRSERTAQQDVGGPA